MGGYRLHIIAMSMLLVEGACGQSRPTALDWAVDVGSVVDQTLDNPTVRDQFVPATAWAVSAGGTSEEWGESISVDSAGNGYVTGSFYSTVSFGSTTLTSKGRADIFVAKLDSTGKWLWVVSAGGSDRDYGVGISVDSAGNSYVTGGFEGTASFGSITLISKGEGDTFVAKLDTTGKWLWAVSAGGTSMETGLGISTDITGNSYVTGWFNGTATFGSTTLTPKNGVNTFVAMLDSTGKWLWAVSSDCMSHRISVDSAGNSYVTGSFGGTASYGSTTLTSKGSLYVDVFVAKLDSTGKWQWAVSAGGTSADGGWGISSDKKGNSYVIGYFEGTASFGSHTLTTNGTFVAKLDSAGKWLWVASTDGDNLGNGEDVSVDGTGNIYIVGRFRGTTAFGSTTLTPKGKADMFAAKLDSTGKWVWAVSTGGSSDDYGLGIAVDTAGNSYVTGVFEDTVSFGSTTLTSKGEGDVFVWKLSK